MVKGNSNRTKIRILILILVIAGGVWYFAVGNTAGEIILKGTAETTVYSHTSEVAGKIIKIAVELGQSVKEGDVLAIIDKTDKEYALKQLELTLVQKQMALKSLIEGTDPAQVRQVQNSVTVAKTAYDKAKRDYDSALALFEAGAASKSNLDNVKYQFDVAKAQLDTANQQLSLIASGADEEAIASAEAGVAQIESQISQAKDELEKCGIKAGCNGTVMSINYTRGDMVSPGFNIMDLASEDEIYLLAYLPVDYMDSVNYDQELVILHDDEKYKGKLVYIDVKSRYTPKDMQTAANKNKESVKIKVKLSPDVPLKPGQEAKLEIRKNLDKN